VSRSWRSSKMLATTTIIASAAVSRTDQQTKGRQKCPVMKKDAGRLSLATPMEVSMSVVMGEPSASSSSSWRSLWTRTR